MDRVIRKTIVCYVKSIIIPLYDLCDKGHGRDHIFNVIERSFEISKSLDVNPEIVYVVAAFHDIGMAMGPKKIHEINSSNIVKDDPMLAMWFTPDEIKIIREAIEDHRASSDKEPRNIYGKIVADADKNMNIPEYILRCYYYGKEHFPDSTYEEEMQRVKDHLIDKFGINGYAKLHLNTKENLESLNAIRELINDDNLFMQKYQELIPRN